MKVTGDMLSPVQLALLVDIERAELERKGKQFIGPINPKVSSVVEKLVPNLRDKSRYILHYRNLQLYLTLGKYFFS